MKKVVVSWSGGKDSCLACYKAIGQGLDVVYLLNCASSEYGRASGHGVRQELVALQAEALGIPLHQNWVAGKDYEEKFVAALCKMKEEGVEAVVTGDIHLADAKEWMEKVSAQAGIKPIFPLWGKPPGEILPEFINAGFETILVCGKADFFEKEWLGRKLDDGFIEDMKRSKPQVDICGEQGEFHTFVIDGPIFKKRLELSFGEKVLRDGYWFQDLVKSQPQ